MANRFVMPYADAFDTNGVPRGGAKLYFYESGTSTPQTTYSDAALTTPNANPVVADSAGVWPAIFLPNTQNFRVVLTDANDVSVWTADPYSPPDSSGGTIWVPAANVSGTADAIALTPAPPLSVYEAGNRYQFVAEGNNTGPVTVNVSGLGSKSLLDATGNALSSGDIVTGGVVTIVYDGSAFRLISDPPSAADVQTYSASGTWTKPSTATFVLVRLYAGGGGGGSGRRGASGSTRCGGGGGGGGAYAERFYLASALSSTESVSIGAGGTGGAAITADGTDGNAGSQGGNSTFSSGANLLTAFGGAGGRGGTNSSGGGGGGGGVLSAGSTTTGGEPRNGATSAGSQQFGGGDASTTNLDGQPSAMGGGAGGASYSAGASSASGAGGASFQGGPGGGGGGSIDSGNAAKAGGAGGTSSGVSGSGGAGGAATGANGTAGTGRQGGGGGGSGATTGGAGGAGGSRGAGGGGGAASVNGNNSGAGGNGAAGYCEVISW